MNSDDLQQLEIGIDGMEAETEREENIKIADRPKKARKTPSITVLVGFLLIGAVLVWMRYDFQNQLRVINAAGSDRIKGLCPGFSNVSFGS